MVVDATAEETSSPPDLLNASSISAWFNPFFCKKAIFFPLSADLTLGEVRNETADLIMSSLSEDTMAVVGSVTAVVVVMGAIAGIGKVVGAAGLTGAVSATFGVGWLAKRLSSLGELESDIVKERECAWKRVQEI